MNHLSFPHPAVVFVGALLGATPLLADTQIVFDNTSNLINQTPNFFSSREYGDELALAGTARYVTEFQFAYYGNLTNTLDRSFHIRFYANDGSDAFPGAPVALRPRTVLWDSGDQAMLNGVNRVTLAVPSVLVPDTFSWSATFVGVDGVTNNQAGLMLANPATVGAILPGTSKLPPVVGSYDDFWKKDLPDPLNNNEGWMLYNFGFEPTDQKGNFFALVKADTSAQPGLSLVTTRSTFSAITNDVILWNQLASTTPLKNPANAISVGGVRVSARTTSRTPALALSDASFAFATGESLINNQAGGAVTFDLDQKVFAFGVELQNAFKRAGAYSISAYRVSPGGTNLLGSFTVDRGAGNVLTFVGIENPLAEINRVVITDDSRHFFLGRVSLKALKAPAAKLVQLSSFKAIRWPIASPGFQVQYATNLTPPIVWKPATNSVFSLNGFYHQYVTNLAEPRVFFRLAPSIP